MNSCRCAEVLSLCLKSEGSGRSPADGSASPGENKTKEEEKEEWSSVLPPSSASPAFLCTLLIHIWCSQCFRARRDTLHKLWRLLQHFPSEEKFYEAPMSGFNSGPCMRAR